MTELSQYTTRLDQLLSEEGRSASGSALLEQPVDGIQLDPEDVFFGNQDPSYVIKHERGEHRIIVFLKAQGLSNKEIAERLKCTSVMVGYVLKQPWARARLAKEIKDAGRDQLSTILKGAMVDSVLTLIDVRDDPKAKGSDKIAASNALLDRWLGKPTQHIESIHATVESNVSDIQGLKDELAKVETEISRVTGGSPTRN